MKDADAIFDQAKFNLSLLTAGTISQG